MNRPLEGHKVVSSDEMARIEKIAIQSGDSQGDTTGAHYMKIAARGIVERLEHLVEKKKLGKSVAILSAKGNNSGDGYTVAEILKGKGYQVVVYQLFPLESCSPLCREHANRFLTMNGHIILVTKASQLQEPLEGVVLDALLGTGFQKAIDGLMADVVNRVNDWKIPKISVDIASGVPGNTGIIVGPAIKADYTVSLGLYKIGHFLNQGMEHTGKIALSSFGMSEKYLNQMEPFAYVVDRGILKEYLPTLKRNVHKYSVGQTAILAGSPSMAGAAMLASHAAMRAGSGIVKLFHQEKTEDEFSNAPYELIKVPISYQDPRPLEKELKRSKSFVAGPGLGRKKEIKELLKKVFSILTVPTVLDADALYFLSELDCPKVPLILTPHEGELLHLLQLSKKPEDQRELLDLGREYAKKHHLILVYKGAPTYIISPDHPLLICPYGNPGMATAGSGDVLTGIIGALLARGLVPREAAAIGVLLHQVAGDLAAQKLSETYMCASDIITSLSDIFLDTKK